MLQPKSQSEIGFQAMTMVIMIFGWAQ